MNEKDYKTIADRIKSRINTYDFSIAKRALIGLAIELANDFEKENKSKGSNSFMIIDGKRVYHFNKKQFLKDCGVEK